MSGVIGALRVDLGMETAAFTKGAKHAEDTLSKLHETLKDYAAKFAAAFAFEKIAESFKGVFEGMETVVLEAQKMGIAVEELSNMQLAADVTHTSMETLAKGVEKLSKNLEAIQGGKGGNAGAALKAIGVEALDAHGKLKPTHEIILQMAEAFKTHADGATKTAVAIALLGKSGAELIPYLNRGKGGLEEFEAKSRSLGLTMSEGTAKAVEDFSQNITTLEGAFTGITRNIIKYFLPSLNNVTGSIFDYLSTGGGAQKMTELLAQGLISMANAGLQVYSALGKAALLSVYAINSIAKGGATNQDYDSLIANLNTINKQVEWGTAKIKEFTTARHAMFDRDHQDESNGSGNTEKGLPPLSGFTDLIDRSTRAKTAIDKLAQEAKHVFDSTRTPLERYNEELAKLNKLLHTVNATTHKTYITQDEYNRAVSKSFDDYVHAANGLQNYQAELEKTKPYFDQLKSSFEGFINSAVDGTLDLSKGLGDLLKSLEKMALNSVFQSLFSSGTPSLYGGGGGGGILSGLFKGLLGFADGGTIMPGGSGGIDSQVVAFRKSPNERVDITKPGQVAGGNGGNSVNVNVINYASPDLSITATQNNNNNTIEIAIEKKVNDTISSGRANQSMASGFGLRPMRTRR